MSCPPTSSTGSSWENPVSTGLSYSMRPPRRRVRGARALVDDAAAARRLVLHTLDRFLRSDEGAGQVGVHDRLPLLEGQVFHRDRRRADAGVIEEEVEPSERLPRAREQIPDR